MIINKKNQFKKTMLNHYITYKTHKKSKIG